MALEAISVLFDYDFKAASKLGPEPSLHTSHYSIRHVAGSERETQAICTTFGRREAAGGKLGPCPSPRIRTHTSMSTLAASWAVRCRHCGHFAACAATLSCDITHRVKERSMYPYECGHTHTS